MTAKKSYRQYKFIEHLWNNFNVSKYDPSAKVCKAVHGRWDIWIYKRSFTDTDTLLDHNLYRIMIYETDTIDLIVDITFKPYGRIERTVGSTSVLRAIWDMTHAPNDL